MADLELSLSNAKTRYMLVGNQAFSATVMLNLNIYFEESVSTACTDGLNIKLGPDFWTQLTSGQQVFLLAHETWHVCFDHMGTRGDRDPIMYNMACDYVINHMLVNECGMEFIEGGLLDSKFADMTSYEVYDIIINDPKHQEKAKQFESDIQEAELEPEETRGTSDIKGSYPSQQEITTRIQDLIIKAAMQAELTNNSNSVPNSIKQYIQDVKNPQLSWNVLLQNYFTEKCNDDYSWSKRNRRYREVYMPGLDGEGMGELRAYFDASGSITQHELNLQCAELRYIKELVNPSRLTLRAFSHYMGKEQCFERDQEITLDCDASGGTELQQVMDDIALNYETEISVIFTDGYFHYPDISHIHGDIIWVIVNNKSWVCPKGFKTIHMEIKS